MPRVVVCLGGLILAAMACREPAEPKMPPNSPLPDVDRKEPDARPAMPLVDAG